MGDAHGFVYIFECCVLRDVCCVVCVIASASCASVLWLSLVVGRKVVIMLFV